MQRLKERYEQEVLQEHCTKSNIVPLQYNWCSAVMSIVFNRCLKQQHFIVKQIVKQISLFMR